MDDRFAGLKKIPDQPATKLLAQANMKLETQLSAPANADVATVLRELDQKGAVGDMLRVFSVALPARERTWWACLSGRDLVGPATEIPPTLQAAEAWVFNATDETYSDAYDALQLADPGDKTAGCATAVVFGNGKLGPGDLAEHDAPPGAVQSAVLVTVIDAMTESADNSEEYLQVAIERALDIARGGNGKSKNAA
jgi:hypothetical protein